MFIGIDAGGTSVRIAAADAVTGEIIAEAQGAADADGGPDAAAHLWQFSKNEFVRAGEVVGVCAGITKITRAGVQRRWEEVLTGLFPGASVLVVPDYVAAFHGAMKEGKGIIVIAGTGSVAYGENGAGEAVRIGGRGWEYGDEGSGAHLTTEMVRRTLRALDGMDVQTPLRAAVCDHLGTSDPALLGEAARQRATDAGRGFLVPLILAQAQAGDREAKNLFVGAAGWLSALARAVHSRLGFAPEDAVPLSPLGGLGEAGELLTLPFAHLLTRHLPGTFLTAPDAPPVRGAVRLAQKAGDRELSVTPLYPP